MFRQGVGVGQLSVLKHVLEVPEGVQGHAREQEGEERVEVQQAGPEAEVGAREAARQVRDGAQEEVELDRGLRHPCA